MRMEWGEFIALHGAPGYLVRDNLYRVGGKYPVWFAEWKGVGWMQFKNQVEQIPSTWEIV